MKSKHPGLTKTHIEVLRQTPNGGSSNIESITKLLDNYGFYKTGDF
jgi:hypothetical protein